MSKRRETETIAVAARLAAETAATATVLATKTAESVNTLMVKLTQDAGDLRAHEKVCTERDKAMTETISDIKTDIKSGREETTKAISVMKEDIIAGRETMKNDIQKDIKQVKGIVKWLGGILVSANTVLIAALATVAWTFFKKYMHLE